MRKGKQLKYKRVSARIERKDENSEVNAERNRDGLAVRGKMCKWTKTREQHEEYRETELGREVRGMNMQQKKDEY